MARVAPSRDTETAILVNCGRRCALCTGLNNDHAVKKGQIAHIDRDSSNSSYENLAFLCIPHHDDYDSVSRQSKSFKPDELRHYKKEVCRQYGPVYPSILGFLTRHQAAILELNNETGQLAVEVDKNTFGAYKDLHTDLVNLIHQTLNADVHRLLHDWYIEIDVTLRTINDEYYIESGWRRKFDNGTYSQDILSAKKVIVTHALSRMGTAYITLRNFLAY